MKEKVKYVFVVLVYKNSQDLEDCIHSIEEKVQSYKIVVVNAFYNDETMNIVKDISLKHNCEFYNIDNKGYSYGNNKGIEIAQNNYQYDYIIISNPDITINKFDDSILNNECEYDVIAPDIIAASGRKQNPMSVKKNQLSEFLEYKGFKYDINILVLLGIIISKLSRVFYDLIYYFLNFSSYRIYCAHGSFVILSRRVVETLKPVYDENIFLFAEEGVLAVKTERSGLKTGFWNGIKINHKEDGSMKLSSIRMNDEVRKANIYYYENYVK